MSKIKHIVVKTAKYVSACYGKKLSMNRIFLLQLTTDMMKINARYINSAVMDTRGYAMTIGERVRTFRREKKWTQERLGEAIGRTQQEIYRWEKGLVRIAAEDLVLLAGALDVSVMTFFADDAGQTPTCTTSASLQEALQACAQHATAMARALHDVAIFTATAATNGHGAPHA